MGTNDTTTARVAYYENQMQAAEGNLQHARAALTAAVASDTHSDRLATLVNRIAEAEGALGLWARAAAMVAAGKDNAALTGYVARALMNGADDTWSGRSNDARRANFDGRREAATNLMDHLAYGDHTN